MSTTTNTAPTATIAVNTTSLKIGATLNVAGSFKDPDQGPWTYTIDWGDGQKMTGSATAAGTVNASHAYAAASKKGYKVVFTVTDAAGASAIGLEDHQGFEIVGPGSAGRSARPKPLPPRACVAPRLTAPCYCSDRSA